MKHCKYLNTTQQVVQITTTHSLVPRLSSGAGIVPGYDPSCWYGSARLRQTRGWGRAGSSSYANFYLWKRVVYDGYKTLGATYKRVETVLHISNSLWLLLVPPQNFSLTPRLDARQVNGVAITWEHILPSSVVLDLQVCTRQFVFPFLIFGLLGRLQDVFLHYLEDEYIRWGYNA